MRKKTLSIVVETRRVTLSTKGLSVQCRDQSFYQDTNCLGESQERTRVLI